VWTELGLARVPLDVIEAPDVALTRAAVELVADLVADGETEVTVLLPRVEHERVWHRLLHDRTSTAIARALADFPHANVTFVPYPLGSPTGRAIVAGAQPRADQSQTGAHRATYPPRRRPSTTRHGAHRPDHHRDR